MRLIPYGKQSIDNKDIQEVVKVLRSDWITQGPKIKEFEDALCKYSGAKYAVAVSSGTAALHVACLAANIQPADEVITSPITFVASANCILYCGGKPVFADIEEDTVNIDPEEIEKRINKKTRAIIPVHFSGCPCDLEEIYRIAKKNKLIIIEDAAHALGAKYKGSKIGSCKYSDLTILSFHPLKSITTGEGGVVLTNRKDLYERLLILRNHGITKDSKFLEDNPGPWYYEMQSLGFNYRITDIQAALGISQIKKIGGFISKRKEITQAYDRALSNIDCIKIANAKKKEYSAFHLYVVLVDFRKIQKTRKEVMEYLRGFGICTQVHYIPVHTQPYYRRRFGYKWGDYPRAEKYYESALTLPLYPGLAGPSLDYVVKKFLSVLDNNKYKGQL